MTNNELPPKPERDVIREVDWLAVAPWLLLLRAPSAVIGWPLLIGAVGTVLFPWQGASSPVTEFGLAHALHASSNVFASILPEGASAGWKASRFLMWLLAALLTVSYASRNLTSDSSIGFFESLKSVKKQLLPAVVCFGLFALPCGVFVLLLVIWGAFLEFEWSSVPTSILTPLAWWFGALPLTALVAIATIGLPLALVAIVVDRADSFDATSRAFAYTTQRIGRLFWYVTVAAVTGVAAGALVELLLSGGQIVMHEFGGKPASPYANSMLQWLSDVSVRAARGFYPTYAFVTMTAIYLLLRRDIDGQPLDEIAHAEGAA